MDRLYLMTCAFFLVSCASNQQTGLVEGKLQPCPSSPNCVCTQDPDPDRQTEPLSFTSNVERTKEVIKEVVGTFPRVELVEETELYLHYEFRSWLFGFVDDMEVLIDASERLIHFRSAARSGYYDFGVNRGRVASIKELIQEKSP